MIFLRSCSELVVTCIIPARFESSRFLGKLLQPLNGIEVLGMTYLRAVDSGLFTQVIIASGDELISDYCERNNFKFSETYGEYSNGSERVIAAAQNLGIQDDLVNLQADQPLFEAGDLKKLLDQEAESSSVKTLVYPVKDIFIETGSNPVHATLNANSEIITFSRCKIPAGHSNLKHFFHIGIYFYPIDALKRISSEKVFHDCNWSKLESLEQLNLLCSGIKMIGVIANKLVPEINTQEDLKVAREYLKQERVKHE